MYVWCLLVLELSSTFYLLLGFLVLHCTAFIPPTRYIYLGGRPRGVSLFTQRGSHLSPLYKRTSRPDRKGGRHCRASTTSFSDSCALLAHNPPKNIIFSIIITVDYKYCHVRQ